MKINPVPLVSVVIVNWNGLEDTKICLEHTRKQTYKNFEIIVVDNGSKDSSVAWLEKQKDIKLVTLPKNTGFTGGHIAGYKAAEGDYILLMNNDAVMAESYIEKAVASIEADPRIAVVGGRAYDWNDDNPLFNTDNHFYAYQNINPITGEGIFAQKDEGVIREVNNVSGSCVIVRRSVIEEVGYLHDPFFAYYEESDLFARIKRAGYLVLYNPELAIWHASGKTSERIASTFSLHMMMRNRFSFAVRNFDAWALRRFLKFYLKMGAVSTAKAVLRPSTHAMDKAYSRAFFYNILHGWKAFVERGQLSKQLGAAYDYNAAIYREQTGISLVVSCGGTADVDNARDLVSQLLPIDEVIMVAKDPAVITYAKKYASLSSAPLRLCIDRGYFQTNPENIGALCAKHDWLLLADSSLKAGQLANLDLRTALYECRKQGRQIVCFNETGEAPQSIVSAGNFRAAAPVFISRQLFIDAAGLPKSLKPAAANRALLIYGVISRQLLALPAANQPVMPGLTDSEAEVAVAAAQVAYNEAVVTHKKPTALKAFIGRHYHLQQVLNLVYWIFSPKVKPRLKAARLKNIALSVATLNRKRFAIELKHIRNEVLRQKFMVIDMDKRKDGEKARLSELQKDPSDLIMFIICRDRNEALQQLLAWLKESGINRVVLIDNDSALPPLVDYLESTDYQVLEMRRNPGHTVAWSQGIIRILLPDDFYILNDPDVIPTSNDGQALLKHMLKVHQDYPNHLKVGLGLKIDDLSDKFDLKKEVEQWESQFWKHPLEDGIYEAGVDTTFAVYKPYTHGYFIHPSLRLGEPYTGRHLPWYSDSSKKTDEDIFYSIRADRNVNTWNTGVLPERYVKELKKQRR